MAPADDRLALLLRTLREQASTASPGWTDTNESDPGVTLVSLLAYLAEQLESRSAELPASSRAAVARIGLQLARLDPDEGTIRFGDGLSGQHPAGGSRASETYRTGGGAAGAAGDSRGVPQLERPIYFSGKLLTADDLSLEQAYVREKFRRLQLASFDTGVVAGLHVTVDNTGDAPAIVISPGSALDPQGELIVLDSEVRCPVPPLSGDGLVLLRYVERAVGVMPVGLESPGDDQGVSRPSRIAEGAAISISESMDDGAVLLARLTRAADGWTAALPVEAPE